MPESDDETVQAALAAGQAMGWERVADTNASDSERIGFVPSTIKRGVRTSGYSAFVHPIRTRPNLTVATHTRAGRALFEGRDNISHTTYNISGPLYLEGITSAHIHSMAAGGHVDRHGY